MDPVTFGLVTSALAVGAAASSVAVPVAATTAVVAGTVGPIVQGVMSYQASQDAARAKREQGRMERASGEKQSARRLQALQRYEQRVRNIAGAGNVSFAGSPAVAVADASGSVGQDVAQLTENARNAQRMLESEANSLETAGAINLAGGITSGLLNGAMIGFRVAGV